MHSGEMYTGNQVAAVEAVDSAVAEASELVVGREILPNKHDRELAVPVQVEADRGAFAFVYLQNKMTPFTIQFDSAFILYLLHHSESGQDIDSSIC